MTRILIAEDEPEVRKYLKLALNCQGYEVELVENGQEAVDCLENHGENISLLLLDLMMPIKDGFETLKEVRCGYPLRIMYSSERSYSSKRRRSRFLIEANRA